MTHLFLDAHQDLAYNMAAFGRDYTRSVAETRRLEAGSAIPSYNGNTLLGWPEYQKARVAIVFGTLFAGPARLSAHIYPDSQEYTNPAEANRIYWQQLRSYQRLSDTRADKFRLIGSQSELGKHLVEWEDESQPHPVGLVPLMEGADGIADVRELAEWFGQGLRIIGPAWAGNAYCGGTREPGPLTAAGRTLLREMGANGFILDLSHMDPEAAFQSLEIYEGPVIVSHANAKSLVKGAMFNRLLEDDLLRALLERDAVIGVVPLNSFLNWNWKAEGSRQKVSLRMLAEQVDYICQMAGDARHVGIGSDFDGGYGVESVPAEVDSIADLPKLNPFLLEMGYSDEAVRGIDAGNFLRVLESSLPA